MFRVFCLIGSYRYYWCGSHWTMWPWAAKPLPLKQVQQVAKAEQADFEPMGGS
jgi:hypothetical protein